MPEENERARGKDERDPGQQDQDSDAGCGYANAAVARDIDNMSATKALNEMTSYEKLLSKKPDLTKVRVCGSVGFVYVPKRKNKLRPKAEPDLLLGFAHTAPGYRLLHLRTGRIVEAKDVKFREDVTVSKKYLNALLVGQHKNYYYIPFVPLPDEFVAEESVHEGKANRMPSEVTLNQSETVVETVVSSSDESENDELVETSPGQVAGQPAVLPLPRRESAKTWNMRGKPCTVTEEIKQGPTTQCALRQLSTVNGS
ncbi:hypothetical protein PHMEG_00017299 [Phytophthora megakarya]|uniref:Retroviral polymerase SH3-like domain-containing protein n=1 Tax=Phytophthora megakarya TaxID=4795 RepID=A0A225VWL5_9STRA|nr:hypothetical protein PHMEG_00017299 [Phytophthora megakarya]